MSLDQRMKDQSEVARLAALPSFWSDLVAYVGTEEAAEVWFNNENRRLGGATPRDAIVTMGETRVADELGEEFDHLTLENRDGIRFSQRLQYLSVTGVEPVPLPQVPPCPSCGAADGWISNWSFDAWVTRTVLRDGIVLERETQIGDWPKSIDFECRACQEVMDETQHAQGVADLKKIVHFRG